VTEVSIKEQAKAFIIWREGTSVGWDCSIKDLAEATGLGPVDVSQIVRARGWPVNPDDSRPESYVTDISHYFARRESLQNRGIVGNRKPPALNPVKQLLEISQEAETDDEIFAH